MTAHGDPIERSNGRVATNADERLALVEGDHSATIDFRKARFRTRGGFQAPVEVSFTSGGECHMRRQSFATVLIGKNILVREGIARILRAEHFRILASVSGVDELPSTLQSLQPLFIIVQAGDDFDLAAEHIGLVRDQHPGGRIAIVANHYRPADMALAFRAGASGYFVNVNCCDAFIKSIELVAMGETVFPPAFLSFALDTKSDRGSKAALPHEDERSQDTVAPQLSPREKSILRYLVDGDSNKIIARKIDIAEATVKVHVKAILRKIRVQNRTQAAIWAMNHGALAHAELSDAPPSGLDIDRQMPKPINLIPTSSKTHVN
jgi:two-component system nitrate/nitrite response regulator NarL